MLQKGGKIIDINKFLLEHYDKDDNYFDRKFTKVKKLVVGRKYLAISSHNIMVGECKTLPDETIYDCKYVRRGECISSSAVRGTFGWCVQMKRDGTYGGNNRDGQLYELTRRLPECFKLVEEK